MSSSTPDGCPRRDFRFELVTLLIAFVVWRTNSPAPVYPLAAVLYALTGRTADDLARICKALSAARDIGPIRSPRRRGAASKQADG